MEYNDSCLGFLADVFAGHIPFQDTVNPADVLLTHPSRLAAYSEGSHQNIAITHGVVSQENVQRHLPAWPPNHPRCPFFDINDDSTKPSAAGAVRSIRQRFRDVRADNAAPKPCKWQPQGSPVCGQAVTGSSVPQHLADHGIRNMGRNRLAECCWQGCNVFIKRQGMTRHFREVHLGLKRKSCTV